MAIDNGNVKVPTGYSINLASLILENNYFEFNGRFTIKNCMGTAIGTKFAPAFANLFMENLKECFLETIVFLTLGFGVDLGIICLWYGYVERKS